MIDKKPQAEIPLPLKWFIGIVVAYLAIKGVVFLYQWIAAGDLEMARILRYQDCMRSYDDVDYCKGYW